MNAHGHRFSREMLSSGCHGGGLNDSAVFMKQRIVEDFKTGSFALRNHVAFIILARLASDPCDIMQNSRYCITD